MASYRATNQLHVKLLTYAMGGIRSHDKHVLAFPRSVPLTQIIEPFSISRPKLEYAVSIREPFTTNCVFKHDIARRA